MIVKKNLSLNEGKIGIFIGPPDYILLILMDMIMKITFNVSNRLIIAHID
jgi:hypothetical protein